MLLCERSLMLVSPSSKSQRTDTPTFSVTSTHVQYKRSKEKTETKIYLKIYFVHGYLAVPQGASRS